MRYFYIVAYDISHPRRLQRVMKTVRDFGERAQLSVFICQLTEKDLVVLKERLREEINSREDQVIFVRLGPVESNSMDAKVESLGRPLSVRDMKIMIY